MLWAAFLGIVQNCLQLVVSRARYVDVLVDHKSQHALAAAAPHNAGFPRIQGKAFIACNRLHTMKQRIELGRKSTISREGQIVRVSCVVRSEDTR